MDGGAQSGHRGEIRRSRDDRCAECGDAVGSEWLYYRQDTAILRVSSNSWE